MKLFILFILLLPTISSSEELFLHVKAKHVKHMGIPPIDNCNLGLEKSKSDVQDGGEEVVCWQFYSWHMYKAKIKGIVYGEIKSNTIYFAVYAHTKFNEQYLRDFYVRLKPLDAERKEFLGVKYYAVEQQAPKKTICLEEKLPEKYGREYVGRDGEYHCYFADDLVEKS